MHSAPRVMTLAALLLVTMGMLVGGAPPPTTPPPPPACLGVRELCIAKPAKGPTTTPRPGATPGTAGPTKTMAPPTTPPTMGTTTQPSVSHMKMPCCGDLQDRKNQVKGMRDKKGYPKKPKREIRMCGTINGIGQCCTLVGSICVNNTIGGCQLATCCNDQGSVCRDFFSALAQSLIPRCCYPAGAIGSCRPNPNQTPGLGNCCPDAVCDKKRKRCVPIPPAATTTPAPPTTMKTTKKM